MFSQVHFFSSGCPCTRLGPWCIALGIQTPALSATACLLLSDWWSLQVPGFLTPSISLDNTRQLMPKVQHGELRSAEQNLCAFARAAAAPYPFCCGWKRLPSADFSEMTGGIKLQRQSKSYWSLQIGFFFFLILIWCYENIQVLHTTVSSVLHFVAPHTVCDTRLCGINVRACTGFSTEQKGAGRERGTMPVKKKKTTFHLQCLTLCPCYQNSNNHALAQMRLGKKFNSHTPKKTLHTGQFWSVCSPVLSAVCSFFWGR